MLLYIIATLVRLYYREVIDAGCDFFIYKSYFLLKHSGSAAFYEDNPGTIYILGYSQN